MMASSAAAGPVQPGIWVIVAFFTIMAVTVAVPLAAFFFSERLFPDDGGKKAAGTLEAKIRDDMLITRENEAEHLLAENARLEKKVAELESKLSKMNG